MNDDEGSCVEKFVAFCKLFNPRIEKTIIAAHNFKGYDGIFILKELIKDRSNVVPFMNGLKIMAIQMDKTIFLDTLNFIPMKLAKYPEAFNLTNAEKFTYPYLFNTDANLNYIGPLPAKEMYGLDSMSAKEVEKFHKCIILEILVSGWVILNAMFTFWGRIEEF
jgi:hypothetical protein